MTFTGLLTRQIPLAGSDWRAVSKKVLIIALAGGCIALVLEPDHTSGLPVLVAFGLWASHILVAAALFVGGLAALQHIGLRDPLAAIGSLLLLPAVFAPASLLLDYGLGRPDEELSAPIGPLGIYVSEVVAVAPVAITIGLLTAVLVYREKVPDDAPAEAGHMPELSGLLDAVPRSLGDDIIRIHAQDHYVELVTAEGSTLLTERFADCVEKLESLEGLQCHRSHWISLGHVRTIERDGSAYICTLSNGDQVPVSRRRYAEMKESVARFDRLAGKSTSTTG